MDFFRFLFTRQFLKHLSIATAIFLLISWGTLKALDWYTDHNEHIIVPDFRGEMISQLVSGDVYSDYRFQVTDSVFSPDKPRGSVLSQDPYPGDKVKKNRMVYVTITSFLPEKTTMPDLRDLTLRQATKLLETAGLKLGKLSYIRSFDEDAVQAQSFKGSEIRPGTSLEKGSVVDLTVGIGSLDENDSTLNQQDEEDFES